MPTRNDRPPPPLARAQLQYRPLSLPFTTKIYHKQPQTICGQSKGSQNQSKGWWNACVSKKAQWLCPSRRRNGLTIYSNLSRHVCGINQVCNHLVYLSAKFGALNHRINEIWSSENQWWPPPHVLFLRFVKPLTLWRAVRPQLCVGDCCGLVILWIGDGCGLVISVRR